MRKPTASETPHPGSALTNLNGIGGFCQEMNKRLLSQSNSASVNSKEIMTWYEKE